MQPLSVLAKHAVWSDPLHTFGLGVAIVSGLVAIASNLVQPAPGPPATMSEAVFDARPTPTQTLRRQMVVLGGVGSVVGFLITVGARRGRAPIQVCVGEQGLLVGEQSLSFTEIGSVGGLEDAWLAQRADGSRVALPRGYRLEAADHMDVAAALERAVEGVRSTV